MVYKDFGVLEPPCAASLWRSQPCYSLSWQVDGTWHYLGGDCVEKPVAVPAGPVEYKAHGYYGLNLILSGRGWYRDWNNQRHQLAAGVLYQRLPEHSHAVDIDPDYPWSEVYLTMRKRTAEHFQQLGLIHVCPVYYVRHPRRLLTQYRDILQVLSQANTRHVPQLLMRMQKLLMQMQEDVEHAHDPDPYRVQIADACAMLDCDLDQDLDMESVAEAVNLGYETFRKVFKERKGLAPGAYRVRKRIERSCVLLRTTLLPINIIAEQLGYSDAFSFSAQFKKIIGLSPSVYRNNE